MPPMENDSIKGVSLAVCGSCSTIAILICFWNGCDPSTDYTIAFFQALQTSVEIFVLSCILSLMIYRNLERTRRHAWISFFCLFYVVCLLVIIRSVIFVLSYGAEVYRDVDTKTSERLVAIFLFAMVCGKIAVELLLFADKITNLRFEAMRKSTKDDEST